ATCAARSLRHHALLCNRRAKDVPEQRLSAGCVERPALACVAACRGEPSSDAHSGVLPENAPRASPRRPPRPRGTRRGGWPPPPRRFLEPPPHHDFVRLRLVRLGRPPPFQILRHSADSVLEHIGLTSQGGGAAARAARLDRNAPHLDPPRRSVVDAGLAVAHG